MQDRDMAQKLERGENQRNYQKEKKRREWIPQINSCPSWCLGRRLAGRSPAMEIGSSHCRHGQQGYHPSLETAGFIPPPPRNTLFTSYLPLLRPSTEERHSWWRWRCLSCLKRK